MHTIIELLSISIVLVLFVTSYYKYKRCKKSSEILITFLSKNIDFLTDFYKKQEIVNLKNNIKLYSKFNIITKISKCDYITYFRYDYSHRYISLRFIFSLDINNNLTKDNILDEVPIAGDILKTNLLNKDDSDLSVVYSDDLKENFGLVYKALLNRDIKKLYYHNIFKHDDKPLAFIVLSYKDEYVLPEDDKTEILRIFKKLNLYL